MQITTGEVVALPANWLASLAATHIVAERWMVERDRHETCKGDGATLPNDVGRSVRVRARRCSLRLPSVEFAFEGGEVMHHRRATVAATLVRVHLLQLANHLALLLESG